MHPRSRRARRVVCTDLHAIRRVTTSIRGFRAPRSGRPAVRRARGGVPLPLPPRASPGGAGGRLGDRAPTSRARRSPARATQKVLKCVNPLMLTSMEPYGYYTRTAMRKNRATRPENLDENLSAIEPNLSPPEDRG